MLKARKRVHLEDLKIIVDLLGTEVLEKPYKLNISTQRSTSYKLLDYKSNNLEKYQQWKDNNYKDKLKLNQMK